jgi:hypothetical protein
LDTALANGQRETNRLLPTFSLDTGLIYERDASYLGRNLRQTLEPRAFFVRTPYKDQSLLPSYDSGATDFNLTTIYAENPYVGQDRIADSNLVTLGVNSRLFDANSGAELARFGFAQRYRFSDQLVRLPGEQPVASGSIHFMHGAKPIEARTRFHDHFRGCNITPHACGGRKLNFVGGNDVADDLSAGIDIAGKNRSLDFGTRADEEIAGGPHPSADTPVELQGLGELDFAFEIKVFTQNGFQFALIDSPAVNFRHFDILLPAPCGVKAIQSALERSLQIVAHGAGVGIGMRHIQEELERVIAGLLYEV